MRSDKSAPANAPAEAAAAKPLRLVASWALYELCLLVQLVAAYLCFISGQISPGMFAVLWLSQGLWLNRAVLRRLLEQGAVGRKGGSVIGTKLGYCLAWPVLYVFALGELTLDRIN